jgi:6-phosphofructokinase 1
MGRSAGWLAYGAAIAGEACLVLSVEDIEGPLAEQEQVTGPDGQTKTRKIMNFDLVIERILKTMLRREQHGLEYGVIVIAEGLAEYLPQKYLEGIARDDHGHIAISSIDIGKMLARLVADAYRSRTGKVRKVNGLQLGYESRCAQPHAFDIMLGSQIGVGAYRALIEKGLNGVMISVGGQMDLNYVPFDTLVDPQTLVTKVRYIKTGSDFHKLARFIESSDEQ